MKRFIEEAERDQLTLLPESLDDHYVRRRPIGCHAVAGA
jgi:hypothetical protein